MKKENFHLTLKFLGEVEETLLPDITDELALIAKQFSPFSLTIRGNGGFPSVQKAKVLWIGCSVPESLHEMHRQIEENLLQFGFEKEKREFKPHLTLGRVKGRLSDEYVEYFISHPYAEEKIHVVEFSLMKSTLTPRGAIYSELSAFQLLEP